jgi:hypothetical protein
LTDDPRVSEYLAERGIRVVRPHDFLQLLDAEAPEE